MFTSDVSIIMNSFMLSSSISMLNSTKWSHRFLTVSAALLLSDLIAGVEMLLLFQVKSS